MVSLLKCYLVLIVFLLSASFSFSDESDLVVLDFSTSHDKSVMEQSGAIYKLLGRPSSDLSREAYLIENQSITVIMPEGRRITQYARLATIEVKDDEIYKLSINGTVLPGDQARLIFEGLYKSYGKPIDEIEGSKFEASNRKAYSSGSFGTYPHFGIGIVPSVNGKYPWFIRSVYSWNLLSEHKHYTEQIALSENPPIIAGLEEVSLNAPSGLVYSRKDFYDEKNMKLNWFTYIVVSLGFSALMLLGLHLYRSCIKN